MKYTTALSTLGTYIQKVAIMMDAVLRKCIAYCESMLGQATTKQQQEQRHTRLGCKTKTNVAKAGSANTNKKDRPFPENLLHKIAN